MISEKAIQFRHPDYNPDWAQKLISSSSGGSSQKHSGDERRVGGQQVVYSKVTQHVQEMDEHER